MCGINSAKRLIVEYGPTNNRLCSVVQLNGMTPNERLTPQIARRASRIAHGSDGSATVWDSEHGYGYRLYFNSARKLTRD